MFDLHGATKNVHDWQFFQPSVQTLHHKSHAVLYSNPLLKPRQQAPSGLWVPRCLFIIFQFTRWPWNIFPSYIRNVNESWNWCLSMRWHKGQLGELASLLRARCKSFWLGSVPHRSLMMFFYLRVMDLSFHILALLNLCMDCPVSMSWGLPPPSGC